MKEDRFSAASIKELFVQKIENMILSGELNVGDKLPPEREIVETMGVSLTVINSGIAELAAKGFVEVRPRQGVFVTDYMHKGTMETLVSIMRYNNGRLSAREVRSFMDTRIVLERLAIQETVKNADDSEIEELGRFLPVLKKETDPRRFSELILDYFHEIHSLGRNVLLPLLFHSFREPSISLYERYIRRNSREEVYGYAEAVYKGIAARDAESACRASEEILRRAVTGKSSIL